MKKKEFDAIVKDVRVYDSYILSFGHSVVFEEKDPAVAGGVCT